ncbi:Zn(2)-C6 fungal-type DNA-binding domain protein [Cordyceps fumosorosea ARSEF 2679]|uniref:Zn(2)-C6 fungal-type DNA-binding domain protein n=1 Tax=Cordyceps fumosorosea (strain ARSEF 2679) TaxID=1081104 RepID=A0A167U9H1_CORFA|nr:Zn(2)-C6 fungal-type DNA-binding domain protein [Cordyceps fumosorosea ARSEF 2679]OAA61355.1 Zn(2)-C6 fungal-type DNA-binding domain protein [Cordyceps fumosorosea ARSEF 2679]
MSQSALWVCVTCRGRKKGCDKQLPKCGYCTRRGLACVYHDAPPSHEQEYPESRTSSMVRSDSQGWQGSSSISWARRRSSNSPTSSALEPPASLYEFLGSVSNGGAAGGGGASGGLDDLLNREVASIFQDQKLTLPELTERYFRGFHNRSTDRDRERNTTGRLSLLIMAMYLVSTPQGSQGRDTAERPGAPPRMSAYLMIKMLFAQTQAVICASTALVQAGLMIAGYEYACQKLNPAYISIGTCVRIAHALSLDKTSATLSDSRLPLEPEQRLRMQEDCNVWWGLVVLKRIVLVELAQISSEPAAELPAHGSILPTDLKPGRDFSGIAPIHADLLQRAPEAPFDSSQSRQMELQQLDREIQTFLNMVLDECERLQEQQGAIEPTSKDLEPILSINKALLQRWWVSY